MNTSDILRDLLRSAIRPYDLAIYTEKREEWRRSLYESLNFKEEPTFEVEVNIPFDCDLLKLSIDLPELNMLFVASEAIRDNYGERVTFKGFERIPF